MATTALPFIAGATPTRRVRVSYTTLFDLAANYYGDARYWTLIAVANNMTDPWLPGFAEILIPPFIASPNPSGIIGA